MAKPLGGLSVCIVSVLYLRTCSCSLKVTFGMDQSVLHICPVLAVAAAVSMLGVEEGVGKKKNMK